MTIPAAPANTTLTALRAAPLFSSGFGLGVEAALVDEAPLLVLAAVLLALEAEAEPLALAVMVPLLLLLLEAMSRSLYEALAVGVAMVVVLKAVEVETRCMVMVLVMVMVEVAVLVSAAASSGRSATLRTEDSCILNLGVVVEDGYSGISSSLESCRCDQRVRAKSVDVEYSVLEFGFWVVPSQNAEMYRMDSANGVR